MNKKLIAFKWFILVSVSAAMSFYLAIISDFNKLNEIIAMIVGIVIFIAIYTDSEIRIRTAKKERWLKILNIGIFIRTVLVVILPVGFYIDMILGVISINAVQLFMKDGNFLSVLIITLFQGILLSLLVLILGITIEWIHRTFKQWRARSA